MLWNGIENMDMRYGICVVFVTATFTVAKICRLKICDYCSTALLLCCSALACHFSRLHASRLHGFFHASRLHASRFHGFFHASRLHASRFHGFIHASRLHASRFLSRTRIMDNGICQIYFFTISTLLFFALPSSVLLSAIGFVCPQPFDERRFLSIPFAIIAFITALALSSESF